jgi:hypothetical protein
MRGNKKLFLSAVSSELVSYRNLLAADLKRPDLDVAVQEDFVVGGGTTLDKLDTYIQHCDAVIHLIGKATGGMPEGPAVAALLAKYPDLGARLPPLAEDLQKPQPGFSYTQWEAYLRSITGAHSLFIGPWISSSTLSTFLVMRGSPSARVKQRRRRSTTGASARWGRIADCFSTRSGSAPPCSGTWSRSFRAWNRPCTSARPSCGTRPSGSSAATKT